MRNQVAKEAKVCLFVISFFPFFFFNTLFPCFTFIFFVEKRKSAGRHQSGSGSFKDGESPSNASPLSRSTPVQNVAANFDFSTSKGIVL
jgi:hypothetical protein